MNGTIKNLILAGVVVALAVSPLVMLQHAEFEGADSRAGNAVTELRPDFKPWVKPLWTPPGGEVESLLFALQAAIGAGVLGYGLGFLRGKHKGGKTP